MNKNVITGSMVAIITPFKNGKVDEVSYAKLIKRQIDNGINVIVPVGTTGESATLTHDEHRICIEIAVDTCKNTGVKVLAGAGSNATHEAVDLAKFAQNHGADGILSVAPYYNKPTQKGLYLHYKEIANSIEIPVLLYNVPGRTGCDISADTIIKLFNDCDNIYGVK
ncbi:MAG: 4-hydroxy-tetrahydrodipicolinate synthase, partial [Campylobacter sp.]|nr:4-hydroxy-tetrahydrodipicolinate synthase [Campylobacter sp.]